MEAPVSVSLGVVQSLPTKFERFLSPAADHGLHKKVTDKIRVLKDHVHELIDKYLMEALDVETPTSTAKCWLKEVRELSYDIDDFLDELVHVHLADPKNLRRRSQWVADKCSQFRARLRDAIQRHKTYNLDRCKKRPGSILASEDRPLPPVYGLASAPLVGIEGSMEKLKNWLTGDGERKLRVVSIVGLGGVGKTTLAKELYGKIESQFECRAFARTSQRPDIRNLLSSILLQVRPERPPEASESSNLIEIIRARLRHKKYFIIIDDLWASSTWDIVCRALPDDKCCSRVLITTEIGVVAQGCCGHNSEYILKMGPLRDDESRKLFFSRFPGDQSDSCEKSEVLFEIVRKCGGFPLATVTISNLLARQQMGIEQCNFIRGSLSSNLRTNPSMEGMKQVLDLCYNNLPGHLKACMLYFSIYKEDHVVWKDDLVKQWIAEGFICAKEGNNMEEVASTYLVELVNGGMIQPVDIDYNGVVLSCTVHYMILNLIRYKSIEENFCTTIDSSQTKIRLADKVRRLSVLFGDADDAEPPADLRLSQVRSLVFYGFFKCLPSVVEFRHLRVLILHLWGDQDNISFELTAICKLFGLKYLEIVCNVTLSLSTEMQGLRYLETLKIDSRVSEVPQDIVHLQRLLHLSLPGDTNLPNCIGLLATLRTLEYFDLTRNSADNVLSLGELANIWDLRLTCSELQPKNLKKNMEHLGSVLSKLRNLKSLSLLPAGYYDGNTIEDSASISNDFFYDLSNVTSPSTLLEKVELIPRICILSVFPKWIGKLRLLSILKIEVMWVSGSDIDILQELPALAALSLYVRTAPAERIIFHREGFPVLMQLVFICSALCIAFEEGALPCVRRLTVGFNANILGEHSISEAGLENLTGLEVFSAKIGGAGADEFSGKATVKSVLEDMFCRNMNMSPPIINIQFVGWVFYGGYDENSAMLGTQEIAEEGSTVGMVNHHWDTAFSCEDKETSSTAPAAPQMSEGDSTAEGIGTRHMRKGGSLLDGHITDAVPVADFSAHLQPDDHAMDHRVSFELTVEDVTQCLEKKTAISRDSGTTSFHLAPPTSSVADHKRESSLPLANIRDLAVPYGSKEISTTSATQRVAEAKDIVTHLQDPAISHSDEKESSATGATQQIADLRGPAALTHDDKEITTYAEEEGSTEDIREPAFPHGNKEINSSSTTQQTAEEIIPVSQAQDGHTRRSPAPPPPRTEDGPTTRGCVGRMLGPLQLLCGRVRRPTVYKQTGEGRDGLLWWRDLARGHTGHVSVATVQANNLMEDHYGVESSPLLGTAIGIFDGHVGPEAARFARDHLFLYLQKASSSDKGVTADAIRKAFRDTEEGFIALVSRMWEQRAALATVGTCCLLGVVHQGILFVGNLGDSRAVLGRMVKATGEISALQLSSEHNVNNEEVRRELMALHHDDPQIVVLRRNVWRVKGLVHVSRSIGDAYLKHAQFNSDRIHSMFRLREKITRPLLSAEPSVTIHELQPVDRFVIFASDGLWEHLTNQEAVDIVHNHKPAGSARRLVKAAMLEAAKKRDIPYSHLNKINKGVRRHFHDDITATVLFLSGNGGNLAEGAHREQRSRTLSEIELDY